MSRATWRRRIGNGIASPRRPGNPARPSARRRTRAPPGRRTEVEPAREPLRDLAHRRERRTGPRGRRSRSRPRSSPRGPPGCDRRRRGPGRTRAPPPGWSCRSGRTRPGARCRRRRAAPPRGRSRCTRRRGGARRSTCRRAPARDAPASSPRRTASTAVRKACSSGCPVPRSVASENAPTTSAARIGCSSPDTAAAAPGRSATTS